MEDMTNFNEGRAVASGVMARPLSVFDVAEYILESMSAYGDAAISSMRLQKLCYYAQAHHLAWEGRPLFREEIQAWASGPVVPALYEAHKGVGTLGPGDIRRALQDPDVRARVQARVDIQVARSAGADSCSCAPGAASQDGSCCRRGSVGDGCPSAGVPM